MSLREGDHVSFRRGVDGRKNYGTVVSLFMTNVGGEFVKILAEGDDKPVDVPLRLVAFYAPARATK